MTAEALLSRTGGIGTISQLPLPAGTQATSAPGASTVSETRLVASRALDVAEEPQHALFGRRLLTTARSGLTQRVVEWTDLAGYAEEPSETAEADLVRPNVGTEAPALGGAGGGQTTVFWLAGSRGAVADAAVDGAVSRTVMSVAAVSP